MALTIGQVATAAEVKIQTIRYYARWGLWPTSEKARVRFQFVMRNWGKARWLIDGSGMAPNGGAPEAIRRLPSARGANRHREGARLRTQDLHPAPCLRCALRARHLRRRAPLESSPRRSHGAVP